MLWICQDCTAAYAVDAPRCPHCGSTEHIEEGADMPKITVDNGPSNADTDVVVVGEHGPELVPASEADPDKVIADPREDREDEGGEDVSAGSSSETSSERPETSPEQSGTQTPSPARATGSRSRKGPTGASTAPSTDGGQTAGTSAADKS